MGKSDPGYILIEDGIARRKDLNPVQKLVLCSIGRIQGKSASCYPSIEYVAESVGVSESAARRAINDLVKKKEITRLFHKRQTSTYSAGWGSGAESAEKVGGMPKGEDGMSGDNSSYFSLGSKLTPSCSQVDTLKLVWSNPNKRQSRKKYWANLRLVKREETERRERLA